MASLEEVPCIVGKEQALGGVGIQIPSDELQSSQATFSMRGPLSSTYEFFYAVSVYATRPHIVNRSVKGTELELEPEQSRPQFFTRGAEPNSFKLVEDNVVPEDISEDLQEPFLKSLIQELHDLGIVRMILRRKVIGNSMKEYATKETWGKLVSDGSYTVFVVDDFRF
jgi:hypothetical protein